MWLTEEHLAERSDAQTGAGMKLYLAEKRSRSGYAQFGSIWKKGQVRECSFELRNKEKKRIPVQSRIAAYWPDGSIKWAAHMADSSVMGDCVELVPDNKSMPHNMASCVETEEGWQFCSPTLSLEVMKTGKALLRNIRICGKLRMKKAYESLILERHFYTGNLQSAERKEPETEEKIMEEDIRQQLYGTGILHSAVMEDCGPYVWSFRLEGIHEIDRTGERLFPFVIRIRLYWNQDRIDIQHTFIYDGDENRDFLKGIGVAAECPLEGESFDRHIRFGTDYGSFHEAASLMLVWDHKHPGAVYKRQIRGESLEQAKLMPQDYMHLKEIAGNCPIWDRYEMTQDSDMHFCIRKRTSGNEHCFLNALHGHRAPGTMAFGGRNGSILMGMKDFWQKYPSGLELKGLADDMAEAVFWIYSPYARAYDYRHYDNRAYAETCYEGFSDYGATPFGVANTNDFSFVFSDKMIPSQKELEEFGYSVSAPTVYFGKPAYYHDLKAFGYWSLPSKETQALSWLEDELNRAADFYKQEVEVRHWYGMYDYGDVMHTYDCFRHMWRYDIGGYAWQNTELMPTMWLWLFFLRSGRSDILELASAMTRHASDVDVYHLGKMKGLGSRHGVRHWGCPCKEIRIGMAGHYRFPYYLLCDRRFEDIFEDTKDADYSLLAIDPLRYVYDSRKSLLPTHARSGPDWAAMVSNWMTEWERKNDERYLKKIITGMQDIESAPLGLISGPDFEYDSYSGHLRYIGESATGGTHLQISMGAPQVWMELADLLGDAQWAEQLAAYGRFYYMTKEERQKESGGLIGERPFPYPVMAGAMAAYGAVYFGDKELALRTVLYLFRALLPEDSNVGFEKNILKDCGNQQNLEEIPWITTNFTAQWCLNTIMILEFIRESIPASIEEVRELLTDFPKEDLFRNC